MSEKERNMSIIIGAIALCVFIAAVVISGLSLTPGEAEVDKVIEDGAELVAEETLDVPPEVLKAMEAKARAKAAAKVTPAQKD